MVYGLWSEGTEREKGDDRPKNTALCQRENEALEYCTAVVPRNVRCNIRVHGVRKSPRSRPPASLLFPLPFPSAYIMAQRITYRRRHAYNTRSNKIKVYVGWRVRDGRSLVVDGGRWKCASGIGH